MRRVIAAAVALSVSLIAFPMSAQRKPILIDGKPVSGFDEVVFLEQTACSGVFIGPRLLLTANHCPAEIKHRVRDEKRLIGTLRDRLGELTCADLELWSVDLEPGERASCVVLAPVAFERDDEALLVGFGEPDAGSKRGATGTVLDADCTQCPKTPSWVAHLRPPGLACPSDSGGAGYVRVDGSWRIMGIILGAFVEPPPAALTRCTSQERLATLNDDVIKWIDDHRGSYDRCK